MLRFAAEARVAVSEREWAALGDLCTEERRWAQILLRHVLDGDHARLLEIAGQLRDLPGNPLRLPLLTGEPFAMGIMATAGLRSDGFENVGDACEIYLYALAGAKITFVDYLTLLMQGVTWDSEALQWLAMMVDTPHACIRSAMDAVAERSVDAMRAKWNNR